jgi:alkylation response protein AidB-like acyl-CoA dehydrogenase
MIIRIYVSESMLYRTGGLLDLALKDIDLTLEDAGLKTGNAIKRYALECSVNKVYGSEVLDYVADECVQVMGGYGYIRDYPAEGGYRDARINRIWEGTNEINRLLIVDMLLSAGIKGELPLMDVIREFTDESLTFRHDLSGDERLLEKEKKMVIIAKKMGLIAAGAAVRKHMTKLADEQEIMSLIADIIIEIFAMESALLRTRKIIEKEGERKAEIQAAVTRVYICDAFPKVELMAKQIFAALSEGEELRTGLMALKRLAKYTPVNSIALRRKIVESCIPAARYHLTKL